MVPFLYLEVLSMAKMAQKQPGNKKKISTNFVFIMRLRKIFDFLTSKMEDFISWFRGSVVPWFRVCIKKFLRCIDMDKSVIDYISLDSIGEYVYKQ